MNNDVLDSDELSSDRHTTPDLAPTDRAFSFWCVMNHARPVVVRALRAWGLQESATAIEATASLGALKLTALDAVAMANQRLWFGPARRELMNALQTLHAAATFALRGDSVNTSVIVIAAFTESAGAMAWRKPWQRLTWRKRRSDVIAAARREQQAYTDVSPSR